MLLEIKIYLNLLIAVYVLPKVTNIFGILTIKIGILTDTILGLGQFSLEALADKLTNKLFASQIAKL